MGGGGVGKEEGCGEFGGARIGDVCHRIGVQGLVLLVLKAFCYQGGSPEY